MTLLKFLPLTERFTPRLFVQTRFVSPAEGLHPYLMCVCGGEVLSPLLLLLNAVLPLGISGLSCLIDSQTTKESKEEVPVPA